jgi:uncharacterized membrane protein (UPF0127 family)
MGIIGPARVRALTLAGWAVTGLFMSVFAAQRTLAQGVAPEPLSAFPQSLLAIRTRADKVINFKIWSADTPDRDRQGLMFVHEMDEHAGMLFVFPENRPVTMWMHNTYIPLDMLFMDAKGKIDYIAANTKPLSTDIIGPPGPEFAVLELNGGACERLGIAVGDLVLHSSFKKTK